MTLSLEPSRSEKKNEKYTREIKSRKRTRGIVMREITNKNTSQRGAVK